MKHILLLFTKRAVVTGESDPAALCDVLAQAASGKATYEHATYEDLQHYVNPIDGRICLPDGRRLEMFDAVYQRRWISMPAHASAVAVYLSKKGVPFIDHESTNTGSVNKLAQYWRMWAHGLPFPRSVFVMPEQLPEWLQRHLADEFTLPCIMKSIGGQRGKDNYLIQSVEEAVRIARENPSVAFIVQDYIPNNGDYRVLVCGDEIGVVIKRSSNTSHKNNTSLGGSATLLSVDHFALPVRAACLKAAAIFGRDIAGVDVVFHKDDPSAFYFFEVNRSPQIDHSSFVAEKAIAINKYLMKCAGGM